MSRLAKIILKTVGGVLAVAIVVGAVCGSYYFTITTSHKVGNKTVEFVNAPNVLGDAIVAPASNSAKRSYTAKVFTTTDEMGKMEEENSSVKYTVSKEIKGVSLENGMLVVTSELEKNATFYITATAEGTGDIPSVKRRVQVKKNKDLKDVQAPEQGVPSISSSKDEWKLVYNDEFNEKDLDLSKWSPYYLRNWVDNDNRTLADYYFEDGSFVLRCTEDMPSWSSQNNNVKVRALTSYETNFLHKFGEVGSGAVFNRDIPTFDGYATKYGYFEIRAKLPDTKDGSHFAWWMIGTEDDMNATAVLDSEKEKIQMAGHFSNQTGEIDIIETYLAPLKQMKSWRPVIHPNGTTDYEKRDWVEAFTIPGDPSQEYHIYGFEWDDTGLKFYVDGQLAGTSKNTPNYRMMTFLSTYATGGMGEDRGIYPKDTYIDYFRVYKKNEESKPTNIILNNYSTPAFLKVPAPGATDELLEMTAQITDQFDKPLEGKVKWRFSKTIDGFTPTTSELVEIPGVSIDENTGKITVKADAPVSTDVFVTAYVDDSVKETKHIKLSNEMARDGLLVFTKKVKEISAGSTADVSATLYNQYGKKRGDDVVYSLSADQSAQKTISVDGVSIDATGVVTVGENVEKGTVLIVTAKSGSKTNNQIIKVV